MAQHICSICLQEQTNSTFLSPCFHFYCFACIRQWVAIASYCPLCKCAIDTLIHSVDEDKGTFEEYSLAGLSYCSVDEEQDSLQSTVHRGRQVPDPPQRTLQQQIAAQRFDLYHGQVKVTAHPPALACYAALECLAPVHKPRVLQFMQRELPLLMHSAYDTLVETHVASLVMMPYTTHLSSSKTAVLGMDALAVLEPLSAWVGDVQGETRKAHLFITELMAYVRSGLNYGAYGAACTYTPLQEEE